RFYDRLLTAGHAVEITRQYPCTDDERRRISDKFTNIFLIHTIEMLWDAGDWVRIPRVMRFYREEASRLRIRPSPLSHLLHRSQLAPSFLPGLIAFAFPSQRIWFERLHHAGWGHPVQYPTVGRTHLADTVMTEPYPVSVGEAHN